MFLTNNYATHYFSNLTTNYGVNVKGSCTYIALGMLLSFYDTYWDDDIIPENYDMITTMGEDSIDLSLNSPGIHKDPSIVVNSSITTADYYQKVEQYSSTYFHLKLIQMGNEEFGQYNFNDEKQPCAINYSDLKELAEYYLYDYLGVSTQDISFISSKTENMSAREFTISMIERGIPVILRAGSTTSTEIGHAMIAYDYDATTGTIYGHFGWHLNNDMHNDIVEYKYDDFWDASAIVINTHHNCSNNYQYMENNETEAHCPCELDIHPVKEYYNITYANRSFQGRTATILVNNMYTSNPPSTYAWVSGLDLSNITARLSASSPYSPQMVFIGWCSDEALTQPITSIPQYSMGDITLYAKWRYDYNAVTATRTYTLNGDQKKFSYYDTATIGMGVEGLYEDLTAVGIEYLALTIHINIDTFMSSGQKKIYFYGDETSNSYLGEISFSFGDGVYTTTAYLPIETIKDIDILYLRYGGTSSVFNVWGTDQIFMEVMYVAAQSDATEVSFTWANQNPFN